MIRFDIGVHFISNSLLTTKPSLVSQILLKFTILHRFLSVLSEIHHIRTRYKECFLYFWNFFLSLMEVAAMGKKSLLGFSTERKSTL